MKKLAIFFLIVIIIIAMMSYMYFNCIKEHNETQIENRQFDSYANQELYGTDLTTVVNKAVDNNKNNNVEKDSKGNYISNNNNSINIDIKMLDNDKTYSMETIYNGGMNKFVQFYSEIKFKCSKIEYHQTTGKVKYMLFEQITQ